MIENEIATKVIGFAIDIHKQLGPGLIINFNVTLLRKGIRRVIN